MMSQSENDIFPKYMNYYFAIMAVSCYRCEYLLYILQYQFLLNGGPLEWLLFGLERVDSKIRRIAELNEMMAFMPWNISENHLEDLIKGGATPEENWSIHEVLKASIIFATYHGMCGLCQGMGLKQDQDIIDELLVLLGPEVFEAVFKQKFTPRDRIRVDEIEADASSYASRS